MSLKVRVSEDAEAKLDQDREPNRKAHSAQRSGWRLKHKPVPERASRAEVRGRVCAKNDGSNRNMGRDHEQDEVPEFDMAQKEPAATPQPDRPQDADFNKSRKKYSSQRGKIMPSAE